MSAARTKRTAHAAFEIRLILNDPEMGWEFVAIREGRLVAASDGDANFLKPRAALEACLADIEAASPLHGGGDGQ